MRLITIPSTANPFVVTINNKTYEYPAGAQYPDNTLPDEIVALIDAINAEKPTEAKMPGKVGQVVTRTENGCNWKDVPLYQPMVKVLLSQIVSWSADLKVIQLTDEQWEIFKNDTIPFFFIDQSDYAANAPRVKTYIKNNTFNPSPNLALYISPTNKGVDTLRVYNEASKQVEYRVGKEFVSE